MPVAHTRAVFLLEITLHLGIGYTITKILMVTDAFEFIVPRLHLTIFDAYEHIVPVIDAT